MSLEQDGLVLGAGTVLAARGGANRLRLEGEEPRLLTLLSVAYGRPVDPAVLRNIRGASKQWSAGEDCLAAMHLALSGLQKLNDARDAARRLFIADGLMAEGVTPRDIWTALEFDSTPLDVVEKLYNPNEPRNPAGSGRVSGQWISEAEGVAERVAGRLATGAARVAGAVAGAVGAVGTALLWMTVPAGNERVEGTVPGRPDVHYIWDPDARSLVIVRQPGDGPGWFVDARLGPNGKLRDPNGHIVGHLVGDEIAIDPAALPAPGQPGPGSQKDQPEICPEPPGLDKPGMVGARGERSRAYANFMKQQINPERPTPPGYGYQLPNPMKGGKIVNYDDCHHPSGTMTIKASVTPDNSLRPVMRDSRKT